MSVILPGMEIPESCASCDFYVGQVGNVYCKFTKRKVGTTVACYERMKDCPLKSVDGLIKEIENAVEKLRDYNTELHRKSDFGPTFEITNVSGQIAGLLNAIEIIKEYCGMEE